MRWLMRLSLLLCVVLGMGCGVQESPLESQAPLSAEAESLLKDLHGRWQLQHLVIGFCPESIGKSPFMGQSRWEQKNGQLMMSPVQGNVANLTLTPQSGETLTQNESITIEGCVVTQDITVTVQEMNGRYAQGVYAAHYYHDGSPSCSALAQSHGIQESCSVTADWSGVRLSRQP